MDNTKASFGKIIESGKSLFMKYGVRKTTIEDICKQAGLSKMTFYKYFRNKLELVTVLREKLLEDGFSRFDEIDSLEIPFSEKVDLMSQWRVEFFSRFNQEFLVDVLQIKDSGKKFKEKFIDNIRRAQERGEIRENISIELIWLVTEKMEEIGRDGLWKNMFDDYGEYQDQMRTIFFRGILN